MDERGHKLERLSWQPAHQRGKCEGQEQHNEEQHSDKQHRAEQGFWCCIISERISTATAAWQKNIVVPILMKVKSENDIVILFESNIKFRHFQKQL